MNGTASALQYTHIMSFRNEIQAPPWTDSIHHFNIEFLIMATLWLPEGLDLTFRTFIIRRKRDAGLPQPRVEIEQKKTNKG